MLKSTIALFVVLIASAASQTSKWNDHQSDLEPKWDAIVNDITTAFKTIHEQVNTRTKELTNVASTHIDTIIEEIKTEVRSALEKGKQPQTTEGGPKCPALALALKKVVNNAFESAKKCVEMQLEEHKLESSALRKANEVNISTKNLKTKMSTCEKSSEWTECAAPMIRELSSIANSLTKWSAEKLRKKGENLKDFTLSLETCRSKEIRDKFTKEMTDVINAHQGCEQ